MNKEFELPELPKRIMTLILDLRKMHEAHVNTLLCISMQDALIEEINAHALASVEAYKAQLATAIPVAWAVPCAKACQDGLMEEGPVQFLSVDDANDYAKRVGWPLYARPMQTGAQSVAVPDGIAADSLLESIASRYGDLNDPTEFIRNGWGCAGHEDVLAALKELRTVMLGNMELQPPAPEKEQAVDERQAFEKFAKSLGGFDCYSRSGFDFSNGYYCLDRTQKAWEAWQARAALAKGGA